MPADVMVFALAVVIVVGLAYLSARATAARRRRLAAWAASVGWTYPPSATTAYAGLTGHPFGVGRSPKSSDAVSGVFRGRPARSFTYQWVTGSGKQRTTHTAHVVAVALPAYLPRMTLEPDNVLLRMASALGMQDINTESDDFNRRWRLSASDPEVAHAIVHARVMERFLRADAAGTTTVVSGEWAWTSAIGPTNVDMIAARVDLVSDVIDLIPRHIWLDHGYDPTSAVPR